MSDHRSHTSPIAHAKGLAGYRARLAAAKAERVAELEELRKGATVEVREGREFRVVKIPDRYDFAHASAGKFRFHRHSVQLAHEAARGPSPTRGEAA